MAAAAGCMASAWPRAVVGVGFPECLAALAERKRQAPYHSLRIRKLS